MNTEKRTANIAKLQRVDWDAMSNRQLEKILALISEFDNQPSLKQQALRRVQNDRILSKFSDIILTTDWASDVDADTHYEWVITAPRIDIVDWADKIAQQFV